MVLLSVNMFALSANFEVNELPVAQEIKLAAKIIETATREKP